MEHFFFHGPRVSPTGLVGFEICDSDALLRSLVVAPELRAQGIGKQLVAHAEREARACGVTALYLLTTTAEAFFLRLGYGSADRARAPQGILATREFAEICPASSAFMMKRL
jgi:amino-acid N-acetyltransferase